MAQNYTWPSVSVTASNPSVGLNGQPAPLSSTQVAGQNPNGDTQPLQTDAAGNLLVSIDPSTQPFHVIIDGPIGSQVIAASVAVAIASDQVVPISATSLPLPTGAATEATLATRATEATLATRATEATLSSLNGKVVHVDTDNVTVVASALPTGASTSSLQTAGNASLASIDTKLTAPLSVTGPLTDTQLRASAVPVSAASLPLPTGAATETTLAALNAKFNSLGQKTMANSAPIVIASDQSNVPVTFGGKSLANAPVLTDYTSTPVTSAAYVQIVASTSNAINLIELFDSSGQAIYLAVGAAASEVNQIIIIPGGNGQVPLFIPAGSRISYKAVSTSATAGFNVLNMYT